MALFHPIDARIAQGLVLREDKCPHVSAKNRPVVLRHDDPYGEIADRAE
jgi:hypothetical protein